MVVEFQFDEAHRSQIDGRDALPVEQANALRNRDQRSALDISNIVKGYGENTV